MKIDLQFFGGRGGGSKVAKSNGGGSRSKVEQIERQEKRRYAKQLDEKADALERELYKEMSTTGEGKHSVGWRKARREEISNLRQQSRRIMKELE